MSCRVRDDYSRAPGFATVGGLESVDAAAGERDDHCAVWLYHRLAAEATGVISGRYAHAPSQPAVVRCAHQHVAGAVCLIPFCITVAVVRTGRCVVAGGPVLIVKHGVVNNDRLSPVDAVGRTAYGHVSDGA